MALATSRAPPSSPVASARDTAVIASALGPRARAAIAATSEESTPPEKATIAEPSCATCASTRARSSIAAQLPLGLVERESPDRLGRLAERPRGRGDVVVLRRDVDDLAVQAAELHGDGAALDGDGPDLAVQLVAVQTAGAHAERRGAAQHRLGDGGLAVGARDGAEDHPGAALLHLHRRHPDVEGARVCARLGGVGDELGREVVEVAG